MIPLVWIFRGWKTGLRLYYILILSSLVNPALKGIFLSPRPFRLDPSLGIIQVSGLGFPSGAAQTAFLLGGLIVLFWNSPWKRQAFYKNDLVLALYSHKPIYPGHCLIIPKRHVERFEMLSEEEITEIGRVIKKVNQAVEKVFQTSSYLLLQKNGREVGQTPHVHVHYIGSPLLF